MGRCQFARLVSRHGAAGGEAAIVDAAQLAVEGLKLAGSDGTMLPQALDTAAAVAARDGRFEDAITHIERAIAAAPDAAAREDFERRRTAYREGRPWISP